MKHGSCIILLRSNLNWNRCIQCHYWPVPCLRPNVDQNHFSRVFYSVPAYNLCRLLSRVNNNRKQSESQPTHYKVPRPYPSLPDTFNGNEQCKKITILCAKPMVFFFLIFLLTQFMFTVKFLWNVLYITDNTLTSPIFIWGIIRRLYRARAQTTLK